jgi:DNA-binding NarL/FixJ family response regulator
LPLTINKRIGRAREISPETVKSHVKRIFSKANKAERYSVAAVKVATAAIDEAEQASLEAWLARADADYAQGKQTA